MEKDRWQILGTVCVASVPSAPPQITKGNIGGGKKTEPLLIGFSLGQAAFQLTWNREHSESAYWMTWSKNHWYRRQRRLVRLSNSSPCWYGIGPYSIFSKAELFKARFRHWFSVSFNGSYVSKFPNCLWKSQPIALSNAVLNEASTRLLGSQFWQSSLLIPAPWNSI